MLDPILSGLVAKVRAVGLVAGTAMITTALVGGGVAITTVSDDTALAPDPSVTQEVEGAESLLSTTETESDTGTVGIDPEEPVESDKVRPPLPEGFVCDESKNHGQNVSAFARSLEKGPGRGAQVSAVAQSDCGKTAGDAEEAETEEAETEEAEVEKTAEDKAAKKAEQAQKKADRKAAQSEKKAGKGGGKPAGKGKSGGKPAGKGGGKG